MLSYWSLIEQTIGDYLEETHLLLSRQNYKKVSKDIKLLKRVERTVAEIYKGETITNVLDLNNKSIIE